VSRASPLSFGEADALSSVPARFQRVLLSLPPDQPAYASADESLTYLELAHASRQLAAALVARLDSGTSRSAQKAVALLLPPLGAAALAGMLGVLETGHFYVPLDFVMGEAMLRDILLECPPQACVTTTALLDRLAAILPAGQHPPVMCVDALPPAPAQRSVPPPEDGQLLASIQYTSGSTGRPRGVMRTHASNMHGAYLASRDLDFGLGARIAHLRSYAYGASQQPVFGGMLNGAVLHALPQPDCAPAELYQWIADREITHLYATLGLLRGLADLGDARAPLSSLRVIMTGGEPLYRSDVERLRRLLSPACKIVARLVSTETGVYARFVIQPDTAWPGDAVPGGYVAPGCQVMVLNEHRQPVAACQVGEIAVRSRFLAAGYWQRPEATAARFLPDPDGGQERVFLTGDLGCMREDGCLEYAGRADSMVKIRGYRVEMQAIEAAMQAHPGVQDSVVVARPGRGGEMRLIAYVVPARTAGLSVGELRQALGQKLPQYMIPSRFVFIDWLARKVNSKVDLAALPPPGTARPDVGVPYVAPRNELERRLAELWAEQLELDEVGVEDDFFALGGDSLMGMRVALAVEKALEYSMPASFFRNTPTVACLAKLLAGDADAPGTAQGDASARQPERPARGGAPTLWRRLRQQLITCGPEWRGNGLPYGLGVGLHRLLVAQPAIRRHYASQLALVRQWMDLLGDDADAAVTSTASLLANTWQIWTARALEQPEALGRWLMVDDPGGLLSGAPGLSAGTVITLPHVGRLVDPLRRLCERHGRDTGAVTALLGQRIAGGAQDWKKYQDAARTEMLWQARQVLRRGGVVFVPADGLRGGQTVEVPFWGRRRRFRIGAAELAVTAGAALAPAYARFDAQGRVWVEVLTPFGVPSAPPHEQIIALTRRYAEDYAAHWPRFYASMQWHHLGVNLELPGYMG
jgi:amino acid adenylation domain-containing protein